MAADEPAYVIAEIGVNHNGSADLAHQMIDLAKAADADAVKFQTYRTDALVVASAAKASYQKQTTGDGDQSSMLRALELPFEVFAELKRHCEEVGIDFLSTAFDPESLEFVASLRPVSLKWPSGELNNRPLLEQARRSGLPVLLSTGMGTLAEIEAALDWLGQEAQVAILQCVSNYPARIEDRTCACYRPCLLPFGALSVFPIIRSAPMPPGGAGLRHVRAGKHFTLDRGMAGPDHAASIEPDDFRQMVSLLRQVEVGLGDGVKRPTASEADVRAVARKSLVFARDLSSGHVLDADDLTAKRPASGISPDKIDQFIGRILDRDVQADGLVRYDDVR